MNAWTIVKNIYLKPREAFEKEFLDSTYIESLLWYIGLGILCWLTINPYLVARMGRMDVTWYSQHMRLSGILFTFMGIGLVWINAALCRMMIRKQGGDVALRPMVTGFLWISVVLTVPNLLLGLIPYRWAGRLLFPWQYWLGALCLHSLSGLSVKSSVWVLFKSYLIFFAAGMLLVIMATIGIAIFRHH